MVGYFFVQIALGSKVENFISWRVNATSRPSTIDGFDFIGSTNCLKVFIIAARNNGQM